MRKPLVSESHVRGVCVLLCAGAIVALGVGHLRALPVPLAAVATVLIARRGDIEGGLLYLTLLSLLAAAAYGLCLAASAILGFSESRVPVLVATLLVVKEVQRFLDNEYGEGRAGRRWSFALLAVFAAALQIFLVWTL